MWLLSCRFHVHFHPSWDEKKKSPVRKKDDDESLNLGVHSNARAFIGKVWKGFQSVKARPECAVVLVISQVEDRR